MLSGVPGRRPGSNDAAGIAASWIRGCQRFLRSEKVSLQDIGYYQELYCR